LLHEKINSNSLLPVGWPRIDVQMAATVIFMCSAGILAWNIYGRDETIDRLLPQ
jgi:hypothetical protein